MSETISETSDSHPTDLALSREILRVTLRRARWVIVLGVASMVVALLLVPISVPPPNWSGRSLITIGTIPSDGFLLDGAGSPHELVQPAAALAEYLSDRAYRAALADRAVFDTETASHSRALVSATLRATVVGKQTVVVWLLAGSPNDVKTALRMIEEEVTAIHKDRITRRMEVSESLLKNLQAQTDEARAQIAQVKDFHETSPDVNPGQVVFLGSDQRSTATLEIVRANIARLSAAIDRYNRLITLKALLEPTRFTPLDRIQLYGPLVGTRVLMALLAGVALLLLIVAATALIEVSQRTRARHTHGATS